MKEYIIKICGLTDKEQAVSIGKMGATHIGMIYFEKSPRHIDIKKIAEISKAIRGLAKSVAVVVNPEKETVENILQIVDIVQFHGDESIEFVSLFPKERVIKAFRVKGEQDIQKMKPFMEEGYTVLIDAYSEKSYGGTGKQINPKLAKKISDIYPKTVLSGGLSPDNIKELLEYVKPYGVDASSKLEIKPGVKDLNRVKKFIKMAREFYESDN
ncbi:phosphoribosylanthranilate isomerase [Persephonella hydrogeniphila]|uniref:N-(5'-phosphoribosyl)anthranilate isomerase n=1 Tax=Persephonella hydrogeniphila TaxID=198703 RepID=A0A285NC94_9AQUI|nr:phosphoribosylanthranilate isomerase [Persephonella hydrogeniphila]SNZ07070.1 phosphoribosylanthranilate isomerase [Persephonella hydrogeniphila]